jgi:hypothetical protein
MHAISQHKSALCIRIPNLYSQSLSWLNDIQRTIAILIDEILYHSHHSHNIRLYLQFGCTFKSAEHGAGPMFVYMHAFYASAGFQVKASGIEAHSFTDQTQEFVVLSSSSQFETNK